MSFFKRKKDPKERRDNYFFSFEEKKEQARRWFGEKCKDISCTACGLSKFSIAKHFIYTKSSLGKFFSNSFHPQVMIVCTNCGKTEYFDAVVMKIFKATEP